jgi:hypothetical protein
MEQLANVYGASLQPVGAGANRAGYLREKRLVAASG